MQNIEVNDSNILFGNSIIISETDVLFNHNDDNDRISSPSPFAFNKKRKKNRESCVLSYHHTINSFIIFLFYYLTNYSTNYLTNYSINYSIN